MAHEPGPDNLADGIRLALEVFDSDSDRQGIRNTIYIFTDTADDGTAWQDESQMAKDENTGGGHYGLSNVIVQEEKKLAYFVNL